MKKTIIKTKDCGSCGRSYKVNSIPKNKPQYDSKGNLAGFMFNCICKTTLMVVVTIMALAIFAASCGSQKDDECGKDQYGQGKDCPALKQVDDFFEIKGSVVGAFEVEVDGSRYDDIEAFYSAEVAALPQKMVDAGYAGYKPKLDAQIGFKDLTDQMDVFVAPKQHRGYAAKTYVGADDNFKFRLPADASGDEYQLRAVKRIKLSLTNETNPKDVLNFCYNFSAVDSDVAYADVDKPVVLSSFETKITDYNCDADESINGITVPNKE